MANPALAPEHRQSLVANLMAARRAAKQAAGDATRIADARAAVDKAKVALGERGPPWWTDGAPDFNRKMVLSTPYAAWHEGLAANEPIL